MFRKAVFIIPLLLILTFGGCADLQGAAGTSAGKITPPIPDTSPVLGTFRVSGDEGRVLFAEGAAAFDDQIWGDLSFKIKRVNADNYLMTKYAQIADFPEFPDLSGSMVDVITIYAESNYLGELLKIDDLNMIFFVQNNILLLNKISDVADVAADAGREWAGTQIKDSGGGASGVLLGLKSSSGDSYSYRTLWISADQNVLRPVLTSEQIFFPRMSGFWEFIVEDSIVDDAPVNVMTARNITGKAPSIEDLDETEEPVLADPSFMVIDYIGNDYVAMEETISGIERLQVLPVDNLSSPEKVKLSDLLGENDRMEAGENFGLMRENGHWNLIGRINYQDDGAAGYMDYKLDVIPPRNLIFYDTLAIHWRKIKDRVPDAIDAFTSPNKTIALVKTKNKLTVYYIDGEQLSEAPLDEIELPDGETVVMAEWATAGYVDSWERAFISYGARVL